VESAAFFEAVKIVGSFWAVLNERPEGGNFGKIANPYLNYK
jgi:hypothetical protein